MIHSEVLCNLTGKVLTGKVCLPVAVAGEDAVWHFTPEVGLLLRAILGPPEDSVFTDTFKKLVDAGVQFDIVGIGANLVAGDQIEVVLTLFANDNDSDLSCRRILGTAFDGPICISASVNIEKVPESNAHQV